MISAILLAAGKSTRFPGNKLLAPLRGRPLIQHTLEALVPGLFQEVLVVLGHQADLVRPLLEDYPCRLVVNPEYETGMSSSIRAGLQALQSHCDGVLICLGDMPLLRSASLNLLCRAFHDDPARIVAPVAAGRQANPVILPRRHWPEMLALHGDVGCKAILETHRNQVNFVSLPVLGILQDADTPEGLEQVRQRLERPLTSTRILVRGAGEMASAVAHRLARSGFRVCMTELEQPLAIRRRVCFSEAVYEGSCTVEGMIGRRVDSPAEIETCWRAGEIAVRVDPAGVIREALHPEVIVDGIMGKRNTGTALGQAPLVIGLGPGFEAGRDVHVVIETNRGHRLGAIIDRGTAEPDTGRPGDIRGFQEDRVLKSPASGLFLTQFEPGTRIRAGQAVGSAADHAILARIDGVLRGVLRNSTPVSAGTKLADIDPRGEISFCNTLSDKARAISGGVLEAILMYYNL